MSRRSIAIVGVVSVFAAVAVVTVWLRHRDPVGRLVAGTPRDGRVVQARLTGGFPWAPLLSPSRSQASTPSRFEMRLGNATWQVLAATADDQSPQARHAAALALILERRYPAALKILEELASASDAGARVWSDLAAVRCEAARADDDQSLLAGCLAAADMALRQDSSLLEARFNRALALEHLGLRDQAREAWSAYAGSESDAQWASEAREHARQLPAVVPFKAIIESKKESLAAADPAAARALAREYPLDARRWGETRVLRWWADALQAGDRAKAAHYLRLAREFGDEIERRSGEAMLKQAVAAIDDADSAEVENLIEAHIELDAAQQLFKADGAEEAQPKLMRAAREFELGGSPLSLVAHYYAAHTFHLLGNLPEARKREKELLAAAPPEFHAHRAQLLWHLGLGYQSDGEWGKAAEAIRESLAIFERLGEQEFAATMHAMLADVYDRTGDPASAWKERIILLRYAGRESSFRLQQILDVIARGSIERKDWPVAFSFLDLASEIANRIDRPLLAVGTRVLQARAFAMTGRNADAGSAIASARAAAARIKDPAVREGAVADVLAAEAIVTPDARRGIELLDIAIEHHRTRGRRINLPEMLLRRGRACEEIGDRKRAAADFEAGIAEVEMYRQSLPQGRARWGVFNAAEELFEQAIALALKERDVERAFRYAERARARELSEALGAAPGRSLPHIGGGAVLLEYVALPDRLVTFVVSEGRVQAVEQRVARDVLSRESEAFTAAIRGDESEEMHTRGRGLYDRLIGPVASHVAAADVIAIVPAPLLPAIPFAALTMPDGRYLVDRFAVTKAPSAAVFAQLTARSRAIDGQASLLVLADPVTGLERLRGSAEEARELAGMYESSRSFIGEAATPDAFRRHAGDAGVIHLGTHGVTSAAADGEPALLLSKGRLELSAISSTPLPKTAAVVLAACSTAAGARRAEGTISVARAFLEAGAPSVIATLWPVDDGQSAQFFPTLHRHLQAGTSPARAVREAQLNAIDRRLSPALWAAVECLGSD